jgi:diguanylate cyclase (GGDEF)-like protein
MTTIVAMDLAGLNRTLDGGDARSALASALALLQSQSGSARLRLLLFVARCHGVTGDPVEALRAALQARALAVELGDAQGEAEALLDAGAAHQRVDEHSAAIGYFDQAERLLQSIDDPHLHHGLLRRMGVSCSILGRHDKALGYIERSIAVLPAAAPAQDRMSSRNSLINAHSRRIEGAGKPESERQEAYGTLLPELAALIRDAAAEGCNRIALLARANYGTVLVKTARYAEGIDYLEKVVVDLAATGLKGDIGAAKGSIGTAFLKLGEYERAIEVFRQSLDFLGAGLIAFQREVWDGIAAAHEALDQPREALAALKSARALEKKLADSSAVAHLEKHEVRSDMARVTAELAKLADEDSLTGLANRRAGERVLAAALEGASPAPLALLFIDLDHFKAINDRFGHAMGDRVLRECAQLMRQGSRAQDVAARWGGEEFLLMLVGADAARAGEIAERLRSAVERFDWSALHPALAVTLSIGLASSAEATGAGPLLALADARLYAAKSAGRNRVVAG